jgi:hypothetical protein
MSRHHQPVFIVDRNGNEQKYNPDGSTSISVYVEKVEETTAVLGISGSYTGQSVNALAYNRLTGFAKSDVAGTIKVEHSHDGNTWYSDSAQDVSVAAGTTKVFSVEASASFMRAVYVNGGTAQTSFVFAVYKRTQ